MNLSENPCRRECEKRSPYCHSTCEDYKEYRQKLDAEKVSKDDPAKTYTITQIMKRKRRRNEKHSG